MWDRTAEPSPADTARRRNPDPQGPWSHALGRGMVFLAIEPRAPPSRSTQQGPINAIADSNFSSISVNALGIPVIPAPDPSSTMINGNGATLTALVSQTGATMPTPTKLSSTFTFNALLGLNSSAAFSNQISVSNVAFALDTHIATAVLSPTVGAAGPFLSSGLSPTQFLRWRSTLSLSGPAKVSRSTSLTSQIATPEPISTPCSVLAYWALVWFVA
jgi:hypothetical protein